MSHNVNLECGGETMLAIASKITAQKIEFPMCPTVWEIHILANTLDRASLQEMWLYISSSGKVHFYTV